MLILQLGAHSDETAHYSALTRDALRHQHDRNANPLAITFTLYFSKDFSPTHFVTTARYGITLHTQRNNFDSS